MKVYEDEDEQPGFFARHKAISALAGAAVLGGIVFGASRLSGGKSTGPKRPVAEAPMPMIKIDPTPPPPPPPPPPPQDIPQDQKVVEEVPMDTPQEKPDDTPPPPAAPATSLVGNGPPTGLSAGAGGRGNAARVNTADMQKRKRDWYAGQMARRIDEAVRRSSKLSKSAMNVEVRVWPDATGRITKAALSSSTGDQGIDSALTEVLTGVQMPEPPPAGMPAYVKLKLVAKRPA